MSERARPLAALLKIAIILGILYGLAGVVVGPILAAKVENELSTHYGSLVTVGDVHVSLFGPTITLNKVEFANPPDYPPTPAITIKKVTVTGGGFGVNPIRILSVTFEDVTSRVKFANKQDNLLILKRMLNRPNKMMPQGIWAKPTIIETVQIRRAELVSDLTSDKRNDVNSDPIGSDAQPVMLENAVLGVLDSMIAEQRSGIMSLLIKGATESVTNKVDSVIRMFEKDAE